MITNPNHRRYANAKDYLFVKNNGTQMTVKINEKNKEKRLDELKEYIEFSKPDEVYLIWSARNGGLHELIYTVEEGFIKC